MSCPEGERALRVDRTHVIHTGFACVHTYPAAAEPSLRAVFEEAGVVVFEVEAGADGALDVLNDTGAAMGFPTAVGGWDGWSDWAQDLSWAPPGRGHALLVRGADLAWRADPLGMGELVQGWLFCAEYWAGRRMPFALVMLV